MPLAYSMANGDSLFFREKGELTEETRLLSCLTKTRAFFAKMTVRSPSCWRDSTKLKLFEVLVAVVILDGLIEFLWFWSLLEYLVTLYSSMTQEVAVRQKKFVNSCYPHWPMAKKKCLVCHHLQDIVDQCFSR